MRPGDFAGGRFRAVVAILAVVLVGVAARAFFVEPFYVPSVSMLPSLVPGEYVVVERMGVLHPQIGFGDIVVFRRPPNDSAASSASYLVKRVIGLPGQTIYSSGGSVYLDGRRVREPFLPAGVATTGIRYQRVPGGHYFVLGDNRGDSEDSRFFGPISASLLVGRVVMVYWPPSKVRLF